MATPDLAENIRKICTECGLCCSGVLFVDVQLQGDKERQSLCDMGVELEEHDQQSYLVQPCACLKDKNHCRIYDKRPSMCASFDCRLIQRFVNQEIDQTECCSTIQQAIEHLQAVKAILNKLGNNDEDVPLFLRTEEILSQPWDLTADESINQAKDELFDQSARLSAFLENHFLDACDEGEEEDAL
jgi:Fe-S-cluster containining protein